MDRKIFTCFASCILVSASAACMTKPMLSSCSVNGLKYLSGASSKEDVCASFEDSLKNAMKDNNISDRMKNISFEIDVISKSSVTVRVSETNGTTTRKYPDLNFDIMDRNLKLNDLNKLATAVSLEMAK